MKKTLVIAIFSMLSAVASAAPATGSANPQTASTSRSHNFEDLLVNGKYHFSDEAISTVEADKVFDSLIGVRSDFKDRLEVSAQSK